MKKICFVVSSPFTARTFLSFHINELSKYYKVYLVANFSNLNKDELFANVNLTSIEDIGIERGINILNDVKALNKLTGYFEENKFESVHSVTPKAGLLCSIAGKRANIKNVIHIFTGQVWHTKKGVFKKILMSLDKLVVKNCTHILVDGESQRKFLIEKNIIKKNNSKVLGKGSISGVDHTRFVPDEAAKNKVRKELGFNHDDMVYLFLGRLNNDKGIPELVEAFDKLSKNNNKVRLLLVGSDEENMNELVNSYNNPRIILYGKTNEPEKIVQAANVFCLPSHREGFGTSVIEASLLEKPVICSDTYGLAETIIEHKTGVRHNVADVDSLMEAMMYYKSNPDKIIEHGKAGREYVLSNFKAFDITMEWVSFYKSIV